MKRPFAVIGAVSFLTAAVLCTKSLIAVSVVFIAALAVFLLSSIFLTKSREFLSIALVSLFAAVISLSMFSSMKNYIHIRSYVGEENEFCGTVSDCDNYGEYERILLKVNEINGNKENFYVVVYSDGVTGLCEGDIISAKSKFKEFSTDKKDIESQLSDKVYLMTNDMGIFTVSGENKYYKAIFKIKNTYKNIVEKSLPKKLSAVSVGMTIGDKAGMDDRLRNSFNYSGTAHLLVVSGLHLTLWTILISEFIPIINKKRKLNFAVSMLFVLLYLALTGFSVSVVRAGVMLFIIRLAKMLNKDSDSLNSLGLAVTALLTVNPFVVISTSFMLSVGSTLGLILFTQKLHTYFYKSKMGKHITRFYFGRFILDSVAVSISVSVFTLPVFILRFNMFPVLSFISNILIVEAATVLMPLTVLGVLLSIIKLSVISRFVFAISGTITEFVIFIAEKTGMWRYSTFAVSSRFFRRFLIFAVLFSVFIYVLGKYIKIKNTLLPVALSLAFLFTAAYSQCFELANPSVDISFVGETPLVLTRDGFENILTGVNGKNIKYNLSDFLGKHNIKTLGCVYVDGVSEKTASAIEKLNEIYGVETVAFKGENTLTLQCNDCRENVNAVILNKTVSVISVSDKTTAVRVGNSDILITSENYLQNPFEFDNKYDIIVLSEQTNLTWGEEAEKHLKNSSSQVVVLKAESITIYPEKREIYYSERF